MDNSNKTPNITLVGEHAVAYIVEEDLTQSVLTDEQEKELALEFLMENELYQKFLMWIDIKNEIEKNVKEINSNL